MSKPPLSQQSPDPRHDPAEEKPDLLAEDGLEATPAFVPQQQAMLDHKPSSV